MSRMTNKHYKMIDSKLGILRYIPIYSDNVIRLLDLLLSIHLLSVFCLIIVFDAVFVPRIPSGNIILMIPIVFWHNLG